MCKHRTEAPVNGGRNYNGPKVEYAALEKSDQMLEYLEYSPVLAQGAADLAAR